MRALPAKPSKRSVRGAAYVEILVIVGIIVTLGLLAVKMLADASSDKADKQASCMQSMTCANGAGSTGGAPAMAGVPVTGGQAPPASSGGGGGGFWSSISNSAVGRGTYGFFAEGWDMIKGTATAVAHPIQTAQGIGFAVSHPGQVWDALKQEWSGRSTAENIGRGLFEVVTLIGPAAASKFAKAAEVAGTVGEIAADAGRVGKAAEATEVAQAAARAAEAAKAGEVAKAAEVSGQTAKTAEEATLIAAAARRAAQTAEEVAKVEAAALARKAAQAEPEITAALQKAATATDSKLVGLEFRLKTEESLTRKLRDQALEQVGKGADPAKIGDLVRAEAAGIKDAVRYTVESDTASYASTYEKTVAELKAQGYTLEKTKNTWGDTGPYRGINQQWKTPSGQQFEVQFHTPESFNTKEVLNHKMYEEARLSTTSPERRAVLEQMMIDNANKVPVPPGAGGLGK
jgi:hypothetical protein